LFRLYSQPLLDHSLTFDDTKLLCRYIKYLFFVIIKLIHQRHERFAGISTMAELHQLKTKDR